MENLIGKIVEGEITNITNFGAFVRITDLNEEGLVHISEIANEYVKDINDFVTINSKVKVKVLRRNQKNKLELSLKQVDETAATATATPTTTSAKPRETTPYTPRPSRPATSYKKKPENLIAKKGKGEFEDKLTFFLKRSEEKQIDIRRNLKSKQGITKKRK
jgi:S1 RNA binding domain protein